MNLYARCAGCKQDRFFVRKRTYKVPPQLLNSNPRLKEVEGEVSSGELCTGCFTEIKREIFEEPYKRCSKCKQMKFGVKEQEYVIPQDIIDKNPNMKSLNHMKSDKPICPSCIRDIIKLTLPK